MIDLPSHEPARRTTRDGICDPNLTNGEWAKMAGETLRAHRERCGFPDEGAERSDVVDLMVNLLHHLHARGADPIDAFQETLEHFVAEAG